MTDTGKDLEPAYSEVTPWTGGSWEDLTHDADEVRGADLERGALLVGVPMCIIRATFRQGDYMSAKIDAVGWYVSLDTVIGPEPEIARAIRRKRIPEENLSSVPEPGETLIFNEGGTGVYRQIVEYLAAKKRILIKSDLPETGAYGESRYDVLPPEWEYPDRDGPELRYGPDGTPTVSFEVRLLCPRGLRSSEYENEYTKAGVTRYIG
jgi:hypothetical protein